MPPLLFTKDYGQCYFCSDGVNLTQIKGLEKKPHLVVATPGRLLDLYDEDHICLGKYTATALSQPESALRHIC